MIWFDILRGLGAFGGIPLNLWGGFLSDLGEIALVASLITLIRARNCEVHRCWRLGRHTTAAGHKVCRRHHPDDKLTAEDVLAAHAAALHRDKT